MSRRSSSCWRSSSRACTSIALVTTLPVMFEAAVVSQSPTMPPIGSPADPSGVARITTRPRPSRATPTRKRAAARAQRIEEVGERRSRQRVIEAVDGNALPQPVASARLARRGRVQDSQIDIGVGSGGDRLADIEALLRSARRPEQQPVALHPPRQQHRLAAQRAQGSGERRRIDRVDERLLRLRIEARNRGQPCRTTRLQRQRADAGPAEWPLELGQRLVEEPLDPSARPAGWGARRHAARPAPAPVRTSG